jgi:hypothetical protein
MNQATVQTASLSGKLWRLSLRAAIFLVFALIAGTVVNRIGVAVENSDRPAGFSRGVIQGALMPMALPNLLAGQDIAIYSQKNDGVRYKLGYTLGVNGCGMIFFGFFFWRLSRLRKWASRRAN